LLYNKKNHKMNDVRKKYYEIKEDIPRLLDECRVYGLVGFILHEDDELLSLTEDDFISFMDDIIIANKKNNIHISISQGCVVCEGGRRG